MTDITAALESFRPELETRYTAHVERTLDRLIDKFGPHLRGIANAGEYHVWQGIVAACRRTDEGVAVNPAQLARLAAAYAQDTLASWAAKIEAKLGDLDNARLVRGAGADFTLSGEREGRRVVIEQQMIVNVSPRGLLFNQYPARIYVDGKFTSAKAYAEM
mgnify:CR=1 FL=1